jgi:MoaA/NifB/PqqE/SkfB family radical SAM enzyme
MYKLKPYVLGLRTTEKCNVGCYHCSISATPNGKDMPLELGIRAIEDAAEYGIKLLHLSGGEPLLYDNLIQLAQTGHRNGMEVEIVTSTFTTKGVNNLNILEQLARNGLRTVMISYDDAHARNVSELQFIDFVKQSLDLNLYVCVFVTEGKHTTLNIKEIKQICIQYGIEPNKIEWISAIYQYFGRGESKQIEKFAENIEYSRCPYVIPVPTVRPNGDILLCPCSVLDSKNFVVGNLLSDSLFEIYNNLMGNKIYRNLAQYGQQKCLENLGCENHEIPIDMCQACEQYLQMTEKSEYYERLKSNHDKLFVDYEALLMPHKIFINKYFKSVYLQEK